MIIPAGTTVIPVLKSILAKHETIMATRANVHAKVYTGTETWEVKDTLKMFEPLQSSWAQKTSYIKTLPLFFQADIREIGSEFKIFKSYYLLSISFSRVATLSHSGICLVPGGLNLAILYSSFFYSACFCSSLYLLMYFGVLP